jgi:hypothetical protein
MRGTALPIAVLVRFDLAKIDVLAGSGIRSNQHALKSLFDVLRFVRIGLVVVWANVELMPNTPDMDTSRPRLCNVVGQLHSHEGCPGSWRVYGIDVDPKSRIQLSHWLF